MELRSCLKRSSIRPQPDLQASIIAWYPKTTSLHEPPFLPGVRLHLPGERHMSEIEAVWKRMKVCAEECAARRDGLSKSKAESIVHRFMREARVTPWPDPEVIEFFGRELIVMTEERRASLSA